MQSQRSPAHGAVARSLRGRERQRCILMVYRLSLCMDREWAHWILLNFQETSSSVVAVQSMLAFQCIHVICATMCITA